MGFTISNGTSLLGTLVIVFVAVSAAIMLFWLLASAKQVHDEVIEDEHDRHPEEINPDRPIV